MRIRHPRLMPSGKSLESQVVVESHSEQTQQTTSMNGPSVGLSRTSLSPPSQEGNTQTKRTSPQLSKSDGCVSPGPTLTDQSEESNTTYLKPDFYDPFVLQKSDPVCPSPLAMLAKTCQNIGQMMEASVHANFPAPAGVRHIPSTIAGATSMATSGNVLSNATVSGTGNTMPGSVQHLSPVGQSQKGPKLPKGSSPTADNKSLLNAKRASMSRLRWMRPDFNVPISSHRSEMVSSSTSNSDSIPKNIMDGSSTGQKFLSTVPNSYSLHNFALNGCLNASSSMVSGSSGFRDLPATSCQQPTSNSLAQLARLSSSLSLPDPPRSVNGVVDGLAKDRPNWNDPLRVQTGTKRVRRNSGNGSKGFPVVLNSLASASKKPARDVYSHPHSSEEGATNGTGGALGQTNLSNSNSLAHNAPVSHSPQLDQTASPNESQINANPWCALAEFLQQMMEPKAEQTMRPPAQDSFSYNLARSFLDFFYSRMMMLANGSGGGPSSDSSQVPTTHTVKDYGSAPLSHCVPKDFSFPNHNSVLNRIPATSIHINTPSSVAFTDSLPSTHQSVQGERCFFCSHLCASQAEWCMHMYAHFSHLEKEQNPQRNQQQQSYAASLVQQQEQPCMPGLQNLTDRMHDFNPSKFTTPPFPFCPPTSTSSETYTNLFNPFNTQSRSAPNGDYMSNLNSYLATWMAKYREMNGTKTSQSYPSTFIDANNTPAIDLTNLANSDSGPTRTELPMSRLTDSSLYTYWMHLYAAYCNGNMTSRTSFPTQQQSPNPNPPCPASANLGWPHSIMSAFGMTGPGLGIFPKV